MGKKATCHGIRAQLPLVKMMAPSPPLPLSPCLSHPLATLRGGLGSTRADWRGESSWACFSQWKTEGESQERVHEDTSMMGEEESGELAFDCCIGNPPAPQYHRAAP